MLSCRPLSLALVLVSVSCRPLCLFYSRFCVCTLSRCWGRVLREQMVGCVLLAGFRLVASGAEPWCLTFLDLCSTHCMLHLCYKLPRPVVNGGVGFVRLLALTGAFVWVIIITNSSLLDLTVPCLPTWLHTARPGQDRNVRRRIQALRADAREVVFCTLHPLLRGREGHDARHQGGYPIETIDTKVIYKKY